MEVLDKMPIQVQVDDILKHMRGRAGNQRLEHAIKEVLQAVEPIARPKALYDVVYVDEISEGLVKLQGVQFSSQVLSHNLAHVKRVFPCIVTCGTEIDSLHVPTHETLRAYCLDSVKEVLMRTARQYVKDYIIKKHGLTRLAHMAPGSLRDWPITQQVPFFSLFGDVESLIGVRLTETCLMIPLKSSSGIYFPTEVTFESCQLCPRPVCISRRAPFDKDKLKNYGLTSD